jgi:hypothetical protein
VSAANRFATVAGVIVFLACTAGPARAARVRYHYVPAGPGACFRLDDSRGAPGERLTWRGTWEPYNCPPERPTANVTFRHCSTGQPVILPLHLPIDSTPRMEYRPNRVVYDYGVGSVQVVFLPDGSADVIYDSGLWRAP